MGPSWGHGFGQVTEMRHVNYTLKPAKIDNAKPREKAYALTDGGGLQIEVLRSGSKTWRFKYHLTASWNSLLPATRGVWAHRAASRVRCYRAAPALDPARCAHHRPKTVFRA